jgi:hypothetical protein
MYDRVRRADPGPKRATGPRTGGPVADEPASLSNFVPVGPNSGTPAASPEADAAPPGTIRRQVALGSYRLNTSGRLRDDTDEHAVVAELPARTGVRVLDKGGRNSLFKAGWFTTNEHSWSSATGHGDGWIDDSKLEYSLADELEALFAHGTLIAQLQPIIKAATAEQRKQAAGDRAFLGRAKAALDEETYLELLPMLGVNEKPTTAGLSDFGSAHTSGPDADKAIRAHLQQYVAEAVKAGRKVEGEVSVVGDEDFQMAFDRQWVRAAGQTFPGQTAKEVCNAFVDVNLPKRHIWVHRDMGNTGTVIHEGMHKYANDLLRDEQIAMCNRLKIAHGGTSRLDEGTTEYFTRIVLRQLGMRQRDNYENEFKVASKLAGIVGERVLAAAYYDGKFDALQRAVGLRWDEFAEKLEGKDWKWLKTNGFM